MPGADALVAGLRLGEQPTKGKHAAVLICSGLEYRRPTNARTEKRAAPGTKEIRTKLKRLAPKTCRGDHNKIEELSRKNHRPIPTQIPRNPHLVQELSFPPKNEKQIDL